MDQELEQHLNYGDSKKIGDRGLLDDPFWRRVGISQILSGQVQECFINAVCRANSSLAIIVLPTFVDIRPFLAPRHLVFLGSPY